MTSVLRVARIAERCRVLGPGERSVVWVQGCPLRCKECVAPETLPLEGGTPVAPRALAERLLSVGLSGVTLSGGEPFLQARPLAELVDHLRAQRPELSVMSYSGYTIERLRRGTPEQRALLERLDLLVDGPYLPAKHAALRWRGSSNQRLHRLSDRHPELADEPDVHAGIEARLTADGRMRWAGVPPVRGFSARLDAALAERLTIKEGAPR